MVLRGNGIYWVKVKRVWDWKGWEDRVGGRKGEREKARRVIVGYGLDD